MKRLLMAACVAMLMCSCDRGRASPGPASPSLPSPLAPPGSYTLSGATLSGVVFEAMSDEQVPIEGVRVYCEVCEPGHAD